MNAFPISLPAIRVSQPLGEFFVVAIKAGLLRSVTFIDPVRIAKADRQRFFYNLLGAQRPSSIRRAKQIAHYIDTVEAAFPNSIILAANYINFGVLQEDPKLRWLVEANNGSYHLVIPSGEAMASVIDGQHRLLGFDYCESERKDMDLLCAVYMDLPHAYQAYLFATININQRKVDKSLAYEQFGYNLEDEKADGWSPDKLGVFLTRKLNLDPQSPFQGHIKIAPIQDEKLFPEMEGEWKISTAAIVEGIARLISSAPTKDRDLFHKQSPLTRSRKYLPDDTSPLRDCYRSGDDDSLYSLLQDYFGAAKDLFWKSASTHSYIRKTVGIQALFDILRYVAQEVELERIVESVIPILAASASVDFSDPIYQASGKGRVLVRNTILLLAGRIKLDDLPDQDGSLYRTLLERFGV